ncbi:MAG: hypothetical protein K0U52_06555 [Gammaproteobacteria bacterium]|nr:hypothetical protein [Gammaproteobacteria bacterium]
MSADKKVHNMLFMGAANVGKTSLIRGMAKEMPDTRGTIGVDYFSFHEDNIKYNIWDLSGNRRFMFVLDKVFPRIDVVVLVYNVQSTHSYTYIKHALRRIQELNKDVNPGHEVQVWALATTNNFKLPIVTPPVTGVHQCLGTVVFNDHASALTAMKLAMLDTVDLSSETEGSVDESDTVHLIDTGHSQCMGFPCGWG